MSAPEITILNTTKTLAAATATDLFNLELAQYDRITIAISNTGANDVTALTWNEGAGNLLADNATVAAAALDHLDTGETAVVKLSGSDIPSQVKPTAESTSGTTLSIVVKGVLKGAAIIPE